MIRAVLRIPAFVLLTLGLLAAFFLAYPFPGPRRRVVQMWHAGVCTILGLKVRCFGTPLRHSAVHVANHASYLDIPAMGSIMPCTFFAKSEVAHWPVFGFLARVSGTRFVDRRRMRAGDHPGVVEELIADNELPAFFPEGTSTDGSGVKPFRPTLFQGVVDAAHHRQVLVQPVTVAYIRDGGGRPLGKEGRARAAWFDETGFFAHLWQSFCGAGYEIHLLYHDPVEVRAGADRKTLAIETERAVRLGLDAALEGLYESENGLMAPAR